MQVKIAIEFLKDLEALIIKYRERLERGWVYRPGAKPEDAPDPPPDNEC